MKIQDRYDQMIARFEREMPVAETELHYANPFQLLVAVVLSAQCTDKRVNMVTPALFAAYPDAFAMAQATADDIFACIHSVSYPNSKSQHLAAMSRMLVDEFGGEVPSDIDALQRLPGVGRKTANVVAAVVFDLPAMPVDTHVFRVSNRLGLTRNSKTPLATERTLVKHIPADKLSTAHHWLILHGRYVCQARKPRCSQCFLSDLCAYNSNNKTANGANPTSGSSAAKQAD
ncbi:MAG: endonuclease III [Bacteroidales bacterium]|nr:endonuclease III [Bacteroidales bacterium]